jgi:ribokinase
MRVFVAANFLHVTCATVPRWPRPGEIVLADHAHSQAGGKGLNVAIGCRRLGAAVTALVGIGKDPHGDDLIALLQSHGIPTRHVHRLAATSGQGWGFIGADGQNCGVVSTGPNACLTAAHAELAHTDIAASDWLYGQFETALPAVQRCFELARSAGVPTMLNPSPWQAIPDALLGLTDVLVVNEVEAEGLLQERLPTEAGLSDWARQLQAPVEALWQRWPGRLLVVTAGHRGCMAFVPGQPVRCCQAYPVDAIDTLGAGDAFASGLLMALDLARLNDKAMLDAALRQGSACGALTASRSGVLDALPCDAALSSFVAQRTETDLKWVTWPSGHQAGILSR